MNRPPSHRRLACLVFWIFLLVVFPFPPVFHDAEASEALRLPIEGAVSTIDPGLTLDAASIEITEQLFLGLTDFDPATYAPVPELAESWETDPSGVEYRFHLRQDAVWTDGAPVTAHDVVWAVRRNLRPETDAPYVTSLFLLKNAEEFHAGRVSNPEIVGVRAEGDHEVVFTLTSPAAFFPAIAGLWIYRPLPRHVIEAQGPRWTDSANIVCNGSYQLKSWQKGRGIVLKKNPSYFDASRVSIQEIQYLEVPESHAGLILFENGDLDLMGGPFLRLPTSEMTRIKSSPRLGPLYSRQPHFCTYLFGFNTRRPPTDDPRVRKAITAAVDRQLILDVVTRSGDVPATTLVRPPIFGSVDPADGVGIEFDPVRARQWLADAGYPEGRGFPEITLLLNASETHGAIAKAVRALLRQHLGIECRLEELPWEDYVAALDRPDKAHIFRMGWCADYPDAHNWLYEQFHPVRSSNWIGWDNALFTEAVERARSEPVPSRRRSLYRVAEEILCQKECGILPLYFDTAHYLVSPRIKGWYHMALGGQHPRNWSLAPDDPAEDAPHPLMTPVASEAPPDRFPEPGPSPPSAPPAPNDPSPTVSEPEPPKERSSMKLFAQTYYGNTIWQWLSALALVALSVFIGKFLYWFFGKILKKITHTTQTRLDDILIDMIEEPVILIGVVLAVRYSLNILTLRDTILVWIDRGFYTLVVFSIAWLVSRTTDALVQHYLMPLAAKTETDLDDILVPLARSLFRFVVWTLAIVVGLNNAGYNVGAVLTGLGIGGAALALASKDTLANLMGGVTVVASRVFTVNDRILLKGFENPLIVKEIGLRSTRLMDSYTDNVITVPNSYFSDRPVENMSAHPGYWLFRSLWLDATLSADLVARATDLMKAAFEAHPEVGEGHNTYVNGCDQWGIRVSYYFLVPEYRNRLRVRGEVHVDILRRFGAEGIRLTRAMSLPPDRD